METTKPTRNRIKHDNVKSSALIKKIIEMSGCKNAKEASENCYFSHGTINEWLRGLVSPQVSSVFLFSKELKVNLVDALTMVEIEMRCEKS
jgi:abortive infection bacteriophage resistance protein